MTTSPINRADPKEINPVNPGPSASSFFIEIADPNPNTPPNIRVFNRLAQTHKGPTLGPKRRPACFVDGQLHHTS